ncbi:MAG: hypothetical protein DESF_01206 [Desulfovibrio sp.]
MKINAEIKFILASYVFLLYYLQNITSNSVASCYFLRNIPRFMPQLLQIQRHSCSHLKRIFNAYLKKQFFSLCNMCKRVILHLQTPIAV